MTLLDAVCGYESGNEQMADDIADLATKLTDRAASLVFPLLSPAELSNEEVQLEAQHCLSLVELEEHVKLQTYIDHQRQQYFRDIPCDDGSPMGVRQARWAVEFYYKHVRDFLLKESLASRKFYHRITRSNFIPSIAPHSIADADKKKLALEAASSMKLELLESLNTSLWNMWDKVAAVVDLTDGDKDDSFRLFIEDEYFRIVQETCNAAATADATTKCASTRREFQPMVEPAFGVSENEAH